MFSPVSSKAPSESDEPTTVKKSTLSFCETPEVAEMELETPVAPTPSSFADIDEGIVPPSDAETLMKDAAEQLEKIFERFPAARKVASAAEDYTGLTALSLAAGIAGAIPFLGLGLLWTWRRIVLTVGDRCVRGTLRLFEWVWSVRT